MSNPAHAFPSASGSPGGGVGVRTAPQLPDYELLRRIGQGGYGDVWLARGLTGVYRAVKVVWRDRFQDAEPFEREFRGVKESMAISLEAGQLPLLHVGQNEPAGFFYYVMELADDSTHGRSIEPAHYVPLTLKELKLRVGRMPAKRCLDFAVELARALAVLHARGLVHRDIKPSNIVLVHGLPKIADVGLVAVTTDARTYVGTQGYLPPEGPGSPAADVYALGKVLYELATGFDRDEFPRLPAELNDPAERAALFELNEILLHACEPQAERRYRNANLLLTDLLALQGGRSLRGRRVRARRLRAGAIAAGVALVGFATWKYFSAGAPVRLAWTWNRTSPVPKPVPLGAGKTVAVLPFANQGGPDDEYFSDGVGEELFNRLDRIPELKVMARTSTFYFKDRNVAEPEIAQKLDVDYLVTGSVRRADNEVWIALRLLDAAGGVLWSEEFHGPWTGIFALQDKVAGAVARSLRVKPGVAAAATANPEAYRRVLEGRALARRENADGWSRAARSFRAAVEIDPRYATAWAELARVYMLLGRYEREDNENNMAEARAAAMRGMRLDPELPLAHNAMAWVFRIADWNWTESESCFRRALGGAPDNPDLLQDAAISRWTLGRGEEAVALARRAVTLDPFNARAQASLALMLEHQGQWAESALIMRRAIELAPNAIAYHAILASTLALQEKWPEASAAAELEPREGERLMAQALIQMARAKSEGGEPSLREWEKNYGSALGDYYLAELAAYSGDADRAFYWLERAVAARDPLLAGLLGDRFLRRLQTDARWAELLQQLGFAKSASEPAPPTPPAPPTVMAAERSVAVLAFENLSDDRANEYFSDGISEELLTVLQKIPGLRASARTSAFSFKGRNLTAPAIGRALGVNYLVEGSVRRSGDEVRVTARLSRTDTGEQVWSESYTRRLQDVFQVQAELAQTIVEQLRGRFGGPAVDVAAQLRSARKGGTQHAEAHQLYLQGRYLINRFNDENALQAAAHFRQALELDPRFALAAASLAWTYAKQAEYSLGGRPEADLFADARAAAQRALQIEPDLAEAYAALLEVQATYDLDLRAAGASARRALELAPNDPLNLGNAARLALWRGRVPEAIEQAQRAVALDPFNAEFHRTLSSAYFMNGRNAEGETEIRRALEISPDGVGLHSDWAGAYLRLRRFPEALAEARKEKLDYLRLTVVALAQWALDDKSASDAALEELTRRFAHSCACQVGVVHAYRGEKDLAFEWFERAYRQHDSGLATLQVCSALDGLKSDPRWAPLLARLGME